MNKYYDIGGGFTFHLAKTSTGLWMLAEQDRDRKFVMRHMFRTKAEAMEEILSYAECDESDYYGEDFQYQE